MSKFAANAPRSKKAPVAVTNAAGGKAFAQAPRIALVSHLLTSMVSDQFYRSQDKNIEIIKGLVDGLVASGDAKFVAQAAILARDTFHMRSVSHLAAALLAPHARGEVWKRKFYDQVVMRPDDVTEILSACINLRGRKAIPNSLKRGLGDALSRFDEYRLAKYRGGSGKLKLIDAVNLCHPGSTPALKALMTGTLAPADTWEAGLSEAGGDVNATAEVWRRLVAENKLGYMAALRNLRNINTQAPDVMPAVIALLTDPDKVAKSKQLPFRFWSAMKVATKEGLPSSVVVALDKALGLACRNVPMFEGKTLVAMDFSGSMSAKVSGSKGETTCRELAQLFGIVLAQRLDATTYAFADRAATVNIHPTDSVMGQMARLTRGVEGIGGGTNFGSIFNQSSKPYDRVFILTDGESWGHHGRELDLYRQRAGADPYVYVLQLAAAGSVVFNPGNARVFQLAGFSERLFDLIQVCETGVDALVNAVSNVEI